MENKIKVSIIVPIYNSAKYIEDLMDSILNQTFKDFELILVNDGSPDDSLSIIQSWVEKDERIVVVNKKNGGVSSARNAGIEIAKGEYIWFHDHDDYAFPDTLETMYGEVKGRDFLIAGWQKTQNRGMAKDVCRKEVVNKRIIANNLLEMKENLPFQGWIGVIWRCLFKASVLKENNIRFREINHEDTLFIYEYLAYCTSCVNIDFEGYFFMDTPNSLGSSHKYNVNEQWLDLAMEAAVRCFKAFDVSEDSEWGRTLHVLYTPHCASFVTTGYHKDSKLPYLKRVKRWKYLSNNRFWKEANRYGFLSKTYKIFWYLSRSKMYYVLDPCLLLLTYIHDRKK